MNRIIATVSLAIVAVGCARHQTPTREEAAQLLRKIAQFESGFITRTFGLYRGRCVSRLGLDEAENKRYETYIPHLRMGAVGIFSSQLTHCKSGWFPYSYRRALSSISATRTRSSRSLMARSCRRASLNSR